MRPAPSIHSTGLYTAPASAGTYANIATSTADPTLQAVGTVTVVDAPTSTATFATTTFTIPPPLSGGFFFATLHDFDHDGDLDVILARGSLAAGPGHVAGAAQRRDWRLHRRHRYGFSTEHTHTHARPPFCDRRRGRRRLPLRGGRPTVPTPACSLAGRACCSWGCCWRAGGRDCDTAAAGERLHRRRVRRRR